MSEFIYTEKKSQQHHGPISSTDFNTRVEQHYSDLLYLYNKYGVLDKKIAEIIERVVKENLFNGKRVFDGKQKKNDYSAWFPLEPRPSEHIYIVEYV